MTINDLTKMDRIANAAGTRDPADILDYMGYIRMDPGNSFDGFFMCRKSLIYYGVNTSFKGIKRDFSIMHEGFHGLCKHHKVSGFLTEGIMHTDKNNYGACKTVAETEKDANIGAADFIIDSQLYLQMMGYDNKDVEAYRNDLKAFELLVQKYQAHLDYVKGNDSSKYRISRMLVYRQELDRMYYELQAQAQDIMNSGICCSKYEIAQEFGVPEYIIDYKNEAMRIRNYDITSIELPTFDKVFKRWK